MNEYNCKGKFIDSQGRCLLPANREKTSDLSKLKERSPYVFSLIKEHAHKQGEDYVPRCEEVGYCPLRVKK